MTDVFLVRQPIAPGKTDAARELFSRVDDHPGGVTDVLEAETVVTESAFLETGEDGDAILYYIEAEDGATVKAVFEDLMADPGTVDEDARALVEAFEEVVAGEPELVEAETLYHLVNPARR